MKFLREIYDHLTELVQQDPPTEEDFKGEAITAKAQQTLQDLHDAEVLANLLNSYIANTKEALYEIAKIKGLENKEVHTYGNVSIKYVTGGKTKRFDSVRFKKENPDVAEKYIVEGSRKGHVEVSYNEEY